MKTFLSPFSLAQGAEEVFGGKMNWRWLLPILADRSVCVQFLALQRLCLRRDFLRVRRLYAYEDHMDPDEYDARDPSVQVCPCAA